MKRLRRRSASDGGDDPHAAVRLTIARHILQGAAKHGLGNLARGGLGQPLADIAIFSRS